MARFNVSPQRFTVRVDTQMNYFTYTCNQLHCEVFYLGPHSHSPETPALIQNANVPQSDSGHLSHPEPDESRRE